MARGGGGLRQGGWLPEVRASVFKRGLRPWTLAALRGFPGPGRSIFAAPAVCSEREIMLDSESVQRSISHWVRVLSLFGSEVNQLTVPAGTVFELTDDVFDAAETQPDETEWFQIDGRRHEIFLDDDISTLRLANRHVLQDLHGHDDMPLVSWFGYRGEAYDLVMHAEEDVPDLTGYDGSRLAWIGWDYRVWRTYLFDGRRLIPTTQTGAATVGLEMDVNKITWMGWDGENLDIFTSQFPQMPDTLALVFVGKDDSVLAVHKPIR